MRPAVPAQAAVQVGDGQRGLNIQTLYVQANIIYDHPTAVGTGEPQSSYNYLAGLGHKLIRLNINWDYLQPNLDTGNRTFHSAYWAAVKSEVSKIRTAGMRTVLDLHNGCEWKKPKTSTTLLCGAGLTTTDTTDVWRKLSTEFKNDTSVVAYDLFNEPVRFNHPTRPEVRKPDYQPYSTYKTHVNAVVAAIRANSDNKTIWVESLCCHWSQDLPDTDPGGGWVVDPQNKIVYSLHMYPVGDSTAGETYNPAKEDPNYEQPPGNFWADYGYDRGFLGRLDRFGRWCVDRGVRCSIGEVGWYGYGQSATSAAQWNELGDIWYYKANFYGLDVTYFGASSAYHEGLTAYDAPGPDTWLPAAGISRKQAQATILEKPEHRSR
ncbi:glycoside hydrolase family 5 protein [Tsukamurella conjunctivitidis]|uniref:cellulase n=3 Tax=Tsukamurellaceae TaxID=85028 RepID=A0A5C5RZ21_9ACTN|nr:glycoside hydrolase family 5 protein [Tsukamurella columbiensis]TWS27738.1 glycoside hydrolase family 5 protein [Tsukamurella conjunctivitidis]